MNASCGKDVSPVLVEFADVVTCPFTHFEPAANRFNKVDVLLFPFICRTDKPCCYHDVHVFFTTFLQSHILTYISRTRNTKVYFMVLSFGKREGRENSFLWPSSSNTISPRTCFFYNWKLSVLLEASVHYALFCIYTQLKSVSNAVAGQLPGLASPYFLWRVPCMVVIYQNDKRILLQVTLDFLDSQKDSSSCSIE